MQQVTLNIPTEKMPAFRQFLHVLCTNEPRTPAPNAVRGIFTPDVESPAKFHPYYDWEFFKNELEYE